MVMISPVRTKSYGTSYGSSDWTERAACRAAPPESFVMTMRGDDEAEGHTPESLLRLNEAKFLEAEKICNSCPVKSDCLRSATQADLFWSVRGGKKPLLATRTEGGLKPPSPHSQSRNECFRGHNDWALRTDGNGLYVCRACNRMSPEEKAEWDEKHDRPKTVRLCTFKDCGRKHEAQGLCGGHYRMSKRGLALRPLKAPRGGRKKSDNATYAP